MVEQVQQVTTKDPKKVEQGKRLAEYNRKSENETKLTYYGTGPVVAIGALGVIGYYVYKSKTQTETPVHQPKETLVH